MFDRTQARDFADVHALTNLYGAQAVLDTARAIDAGLTTERLTDSLDTTLRAERLPIPAEDLAALLDLFTHWRTQLQQGPSNRARQEP